MDVGAAVALGLIGAFAALILWALVYKAIGNAKAHLAIRFEKRTYHSGETIEGSVSGAARKNMDSEGLHAVLTSAIRGNANGVSYREEREIFGPRQLMAGHAFQGRFQFTVPYAEDMPNPFAALGESVQLKGMQIDLDAWQQQLLAANHWRIQVTLAAVGADAVRTVPISIRLKPRQPE
ncbi:MAG: hypothetical protein DI582_07815 [Azospirillum brasilense]|nr:MAG: hypothetical protein DI582_07815 [Azospirillum brasilense]